MQYLLMLYVRENDWPKMTPEQQQQGVAAYMAYAQALQQAGAFKGSYRLQPSTAGTTIRMVDGKQQILDGPYAESKEQLGGYFLIEAENLDAAISWGARCPAASHGVVEVRPIWSMPA